MQSINLTSGMRANLISLQQTNNLLEITQKRLSTGKKVNSSLDDPIAYFTAVAHEQRAGDLATRKDEMSESVQMIKAADSGIEAINNLIAAAKSLATSAQSAETSAQINSLAAQFNIVRTQIDRVSADSGYKGVNLLDGDTYTVTFDESGDSTLTLTGFDATTAGDLDITAAVATGGSWDMDASIEELTDATTLLRTNSSTMANNLSIITARQDYTQSMINVLKDGAAGLTNADMNEEGANMLMLQTRQALGTTSLSLASQAAQSVLRLF
jgi:flagellin-like hook-associated protein FlgL